MTEAEWLNCADPTLMLEFIRGKASDRKLRLFAVACCRLFWDGLNIDATRAAIETSERYADNLSTEIELGKARKGAHNAAWIVRWYSERGTQEGEALDWRRHYFEQLGHPIEERLGRPTEEVLRRMFFVAFMTNTSQRLRTDEMPMLRTDPLLVRFSPLLFRDIFGNPFRPVTVHPAWIAWNDGTVCRIAQAIYDERAFDRMPVLADALEDAGCTDRAILSHCRQSGGHVRGCWVVDLLLDKY
jgi:hypothetical protein